METPTICDHKGGDEYWCAECANGRPVLHDQYGRTPEEVAARTVIQSHEAILRHKTKDLLQHETR